MADIGLNQNISIENRQFHFQTATNIEDGLIRTEVFEKGRLLYAQDHKYERRARTADNKAEQRIRRSLDYFHKHIISDLEIYFELSQIIDNENHSLSHHRLGAIFLSLRIHDKAEKHLLTAIQQSPDNFSSSIALARCYFYQKKYSDAENLLQRLIKQDVSFPDLYNLLGMVLMEMKNHVQSLNHFRQAVRLNPNYKEAYFNIGAAIFKRIYYLKTQQKDQDIKKNLDFLEVILNKIYKIGNQEDQDLIEEIKKSFREKNFAKIYSLIYDYRHRLFYQRTQPEMVGYEFYLSLHYLPEKLSYQKLLYYEQKFTEILDDNNQFADIWNYLALIHLLLCRDHFLQGLEDFRESTKINPEFVKAKNNLRLVENDGREFLSLIKAIVS